MFKNFLFAFQYSILCTFLLVCGTSVLYSQEEKIDASLEETLKKIEDNLPELSAQDIKDMEEGLLIPGASLFPNFDEDSILQPIDLEVTPEEEGVMTPDVEKEEIQVDISKEYLDTYFSKAAEYYLLDPQELLSRQEYIGRERYIHYHAEESEFNYYVYLFDKEQVVPEQYSIDEITNKFYQKGKESIVVIYYYLENPKRTELRFNDTLTSLFFKETAPHTLKESVEQAAIKTDPVSQLESFTIALSLRLLWLERAVEKSLWEQKQEEEALLAVAKKKEAVATQKKQVFAGGIYWWGGLVLLALLLGLGRWIQIQKNATKTYELPSVELPALLGAPHAAGVGTLINFNDRQSPPIKQKRYLFDYLQKI